MKSRHKTPPHGHKTVSRVDKAVSRLHGAFPRLHRTFSRLHRTFSRLQTPVLPVLVVLYAAAGLAACDNPVDNDHEEHAEAFGLRLVLGGEEVYRVHDLQTTCPQGFCGIEVAEGEASALIRVDFLDEDENIIDVADLDEDFSLGHEILEPATAAFEQDGAWTFRIRGSQVGETKLRVMLMHLGEHEDFGSPPLQGANSEKAIIIRVTPE